MLDPRLSQMFAPLISIIDDPIERSKIQELARSYQMSLISDRGMELEGNLLAVIKRLFEEGDGPPTVSLIASELVQILGESAEQKISPRWVGRQLRGRLGIATERRSQGYVVSPSEGAKLANLYRRYGLIEDET
jgi:hypothetical protein